MSLPAISPELKLLIEASLGHGLEETSRSSLATLEWDRIGKLSKWHQVRPLLNEYLQNHQSPSEKLKSQLRDFSLGQAVANMAFASISTQLYQNLRDQGIHAFLMKGALWSWMLYEKGNLREFGDIDFFVAKPDIAKSIGTFEDFGFEPDQYRKYLLDANQLRDDYLSTDYQLPLTPLHEHTLQSLEIQWNCTYPRYLYNFTWEELSDNMVPFHLLGQEILIPRMENQFLMMLIHHAGVEQWDKLKYMADFVRFLRIFSGQMDWQYILNASRNRGFVHLLLHSLNFVKWLIGEDYSGYLKIRSISSSAYISATMRHWEEGRSVVQTKSFRILLYNLKYRDNWKTKAALVAAHLKYISHWRLIWHKWRWYKS